MSSFLMADNFHVYCVIRTLQYTRDIRNYRLITLGNVKNTFVGEKGKAK